MAARPHKYIFVIGGVMSGVGKGVAASSLSKILEARGIKVNPVKIDPYLNVDAGTMNPTEHGEVFVLSSGLETDQDMGNYERFLGRDLGASDYMTSGMVYKGVIERERALGYGGKCVEAVPHVRDEIIRRLEKAAEESKSEVSVVEIGGTVGDFQNALFIEAARLLKIEHPDDVLFMMVSYLPIPSKLGEMKTRPTQNAVHQLNSYGVQPDFIIARSQAPLDDKRKEKIAVPCAVKKAHVISAPDVESIYDVPLNFERDHLSDLVLAALKMKPRRTADLSAWKRFVAKIKNGGTPVKIGIVGKYFDTGDFVLSDAYLSVIEALKFSAAAEHAKVSIDWINAKELEKKGTDTLHKYHGILVPGGFGETGIEGKISAIRYAREKHVPYFGLCYGMQLMLVEYARHALGLPKAHTTEIDKKTPDPVVAVMEDQKDKIATGKLGGTMRLGAYPAMLREKTIARDAYKAPKIVERHRHRYEVNPAYIERFEKGGMTFSGVSPDRVLMEIAELPRTKHPFFLGTQFHPELLARPLTPHPLFSAFIRAAKKRAEQHAAVREVRKLSVKTHKEGGVTKRVVTRTPITPGEAAAKGPAKPALKKVAKKATKKTAG